MINRIKELASNRGLNISTLEKTIGLGNGTIGKWQRQSPSCDKLKLVADYLNTTVDYLLTGNKAFLSISELSNDEQSLITDYRLLNEQGHDFISHQMTIAKLYFQVDDYSSETDNKSI